METLLLKLLLAPALVVASTLAGRRWGPGVAGILIGQPVVAGPILFIVFVQHGAVFTSHAATASLTGVAALAAFALVYAWVARRLPWALTLLIGWVVVLGMDAATSAVSLAPVVAFGVALAAIATAGSLLPPAEADLPPAPAPPRWDLAARAVATGGLVLAVTSAAGVLGPFWTGALAPFPIGVSIIAAFVHAQAGAAHVRATLAGALTGMVGLATFCVVVAVAVLPWGWFAFVVGVGAAIGAQLLASWVVSRPRVHAAGRPADPPPGR
ncbi:hypothetical protein IF188_17195 [Microbacterium sp. NEAU-LLC]|uniref:Uncharacterized protein n=1 Tax=Microbacterium helvum TaxID=2773713 RepID=A0ABR8NS07_9MICO|nr:hypothetical protein [Microbacterium helvum]MBD3943430.1 hypothetical protein [Microbacterium helvum]